ncbi:imidazoleglycerol-phosphate dehydratase HisB [Sinanaerobacter chloroacetimidivorans]|jgi:imidazoleglycerol-phosphate dehydratase|uniref:Imidazoleglycerol-phosphate dehydratase n=1 Tax=Sinanaerobacter chloroacetimidivorans TaxID=2818044 RepID=A0A8J7W4L1_9FIRM|nr:imidazoleglycerol-phosphate dehydratase HisB [Sinanaerobacter chloroacetimidivorans]MBR0599085.1 imidazoleglycerol-phosphate dehydratase HisB [Sinanaerobacter chloroacetimidivorans]
MRTGTVQRETRETQIQLAFHADGTGMAEIKTGVGFFDHMLTGFAVHSGFDLTVSCKGDLQVDCHHTIEDIGICLGMAFRQALADKNGIARYGTFTIPMDEALASCSVDIGGRPYLVFNAEFGDYRLGDMDSAMVEEFFRAFAMNAGVTLHINLYYGKNDHHKAEAIFKAFAHALKAAVKMESSGILSSKGTL